MRGSDGFQSLSRDSPIREDLRWIGRTSEAWGTRSSGKRCRPRNPDWSLPPEGRRSESSSHTKAGTSAKVAGGTASAPFGARRALVHLRGCSRPEAPRRFSVPPLIRYNARLMQRFRHSSGNSSSVAARVAGWARSKAWLPFGSRADAPACCSARRPSVADDRGRRGPRSGAPGTGRAMWRSSATRSPDAGRCKDWPPGSPRFPNGSRCVYATATDVPFLRAALDHPALPS